MASERSPRPSVLMVEDDPEFAADMQAVLAGIVRLDRVPNTAMAAAWLIRRPPDLL